jgi:hypothetical protein
MTLALLALASGLIIGAFYHRLVEEIIGGIVMVVGISIAAPCVFLWLTLRCGPKAGFRAARDMILSVR